ncbi:hypothetical protein RRG08_066085 [Elysia crispata]|uniref:Uncharacterized protein n=1 Tax=Elysia crispata TaxID=231223 RepID=A0AAE0YEL4_9GAST|nr:hypothetical protein RRG08_066085 [Elysia crispata]
MQTFLHLGRALVPAATITDGHTDENDPEVKSEKNSQITKDTLTAIFLGKLNHLGACVCQQIYPPPGERSTSKASQHLAAPVPSTTPLALLMTVTKPVRCSSNLHDPSVCVQLTDTRPIKLRDITFITSSLTR